MVSLLAYRPICQPEHSRPQRKSEELWGRECQPETKDYLHTPPPLPLSISRLLTGNYTLFYCHRLGVSCLLTQVIS